MAFREWQDMALFALVAECGSFTAAAERAGLPKSSVIQRISQLEQRLGIRLLNRTTRQLNLTFAGERYLLHCQEMMQASERAEQAIANLRENPSGRLRITSPAGIGATLLARCNAAFYGVILMSRWTFPFQTRFATWYRMALILPYAPASHRNRL